MDNYSKIVLENLEKLYKSLPADLAQHLPAEQDGHRFLFRAFGEACIIEPGKIILGPAEAPSILGILISLYALNAVPDTCLTAPFNAFKSFPSSMPYVGAFATHTEQVLIPHVSEIRKKRDTLMASLNGEGAPPGTPGDFSFVVRPLPKICLCYIVYEADEDFPPAITCLYSNNANRFMPMDGLADVGEYTSKKILELIR